MSLWIWQKIQSLSWELELILNVVVGLIFNAQDEVLIALRPPQVVSPGFWEFPGGKVEINESLDNALVREFREEIGIEVTQAHSFLTVEKEYPDKKLVLNIFQILAFEGEPRGCENQEIRWVPRAELAQYEFLPANQEILRFLSEGY